MLEWGGGTQCKSSRFYYVPMIFSLDSCSHVAHVLLSDIQLMFIEPHAGLTVCPLFMVVWWGGTVRKIYQEVFYYKKINEVS